MARKKLRSRLERYNKYRKLSVKKLYRLAKTHSKLTSILENEDVLKEARTHMKKAVQHAKKIKENEPEFYHSVLKQAGSLYIKLGHFDQAAKIFNTAQKEFSDPEEIEILTECNDQMEKYRMQKLNNKMNTEL